MKQNQLDKISGIINILENEIKNLKSLDNSIENIEKNTKKKRWYKVSISFEHTEMGMFSPKHKYVDNFCEEFIWAGSEDEAKEKYYYTHMLSKRENARLVAEAIDEDYFASNYLGNFFKFLRPSTLKEYINDREG